MRWVSSAIASDIFLTIGAKITIAGNAAQNATDHAFSQIAIKLSTKPIFTMLTTNETRHDTAKDIKKAKTIGRYFLAINLGYLAVLN